MKFKINQINIITSMVLKSFSAGLYFSLVLETDINNTINIIIDININSIIILKVKKLMRKLKIVGNAKHSMALFLKKCLYFFYISFAFKNNGIAPTINQKIATIIRLMLNSPKQDNKYKINDIYKVIPINGIINFFAVKKILKRSNTAFLVLLKKNMKNKNTIDTIMIAISLVFRELTKEFINSINIHHDLYL